MAHSFLALRAGGIVNVDDSSAVADHGQSLPDAAAAGAAQLVLSSGSATVAQASTLVLPQAQSAPAFSLVVSAPASSQAVVVPDFSQAASAPVVVNDTHASLELRAGGADASSDSVASSEASNLLSLNQHFLDNGWFVVPSAENEYGPVYAAGDGFGWDVATGEFSADWFFV